MSNDCGECGFQLRVLDIIDITWDKVGEDFFHVFKYKCYICDNKTIQGFPLFEGDHLSDKCIHLVSCNSNSFPDEVVNEIGNHFSYCSICQDKFEEKFLGRIEEGISLNKRCQDNLINNGIEIKQLIDFVDPNTDIIDVSEFNYNGTNYCLDSKDKFHNEKESASYFLREGSLIMGMVSFILIDMHLMVDRIFFRDEQYIQEEKDLYKKIRECIIPLIEVKRVNY